MRASPRTGFPFLIQRAKRLSFCQAVLALSVVASALLAPGATQAHDLQLTAVELLLAEDGSYRIEAVLDLDALALGVDPTTDSALLATTLENMGPEELASTLKRLRRSLELRFRLRFDGTVVRPEQISFPHRQDSPENESALSDRPANGGESEEPSFLGLRARLEGQVPSAAKELSLQVGRALPPAHLRLRDEGSGADLRWVLEPGAESDSFLLGQPPPKVATGKVLAQYLRLGFLHILPRGLDHVLFVLGLFLLSRRFSTLLWQVSAFTLAHTVTLALATLGVLSLPGRLVETLIALSIAWVGLEGVLPRAREPSGQGSLPPRATRRRRIQVVFAFGLLHGLGFAGVLSELGLPTGQLLASLLAFNVGVELGQLVVLAAAFLLLGPWLRRPWYRARVAVPLSLGIAAMGLFWAVQRMLAG